MPIAQTGATPAREGGAGLRITRRRRGDAVVLTLRGELDLGTAGLLREELAGALESGGGAVVVDLGGVAFVDSTGLATLLNALRRLTRAGRRLVLVCHDGPVRDVLRLTRLDSTFAVHASVREALAAVGDRPRAA